MPNYPLNITNARAAKSYGIVVDFPAPPAGVPVIDPMIFPLVLPAATNQTVGTCLATNTPTAWGISGGNLDFAISNTGVLTVTAFGASRLTPGVRYLDVTASNAAGSSMQTITVEMT